MDIAFKYIGSEEIDPASGIILLIVSWHMKETASIEWNQDL